MPDNNFLSVKAGNFFKLLMSIFHYDRHVMTFTAHFYPFGSSCTPSIMKKGKSWKTDLARPLWSVGWE